jgi:hypothetical protein
MNDSAAAIALRAELGQVGGAILINHPIYFINDSLYNIYRVISE